jgi:phosphopantothenoylcysteine decarboxylase/phosphopantothenate--cysteine ligase
MSPSNILFEVSGSIAAWKACAVISKLVQDGHAVQVVATASALRFVGVATFEGLTGRPVRSDMWEHGAAMEHINLVKWADLVVLCPATANTINRLAAGAGDDLVSTLFLAHDWSVPYLVAPAMNPAMWAHPATRASVERLKSWGVEFLPVARGRMACGDEGEGRLVEPDDILAAIRARLGAKLSAESARSPNATRSARRIRILVTSGGTEEPIDGVRSLGNFSTGRTGALLAAHFAAHGHEVVLLRARRAAAAPAGVVEEVFGGFGELESTLRRLLAAKRFDAVVHAAAVGDYSVASVEVDGEETRRAGGKIDSGRDVVIRLRPNPKLVDRLREWSADPSLRVVAFKLTRGAPPAARDAAVATLFAHSGADAVVHNDLEEQGTDPDSFPAVVHLADGGRTSVPTRIRLAETLHRLLVGEPPTATESETPCNSVST